MADAAKRKRLKPKLDRRNAMKNIDYQAPSSIASSFDDTSPDFRSSSPLDLSPSLDHQTSFRVKGVDGEFEVIFRSLGLSGPDDFAIPTAAWEAQKARSRISSKPLEKKVENEVSVKFETRVLPNSDIEVPRDEGRLGKLNVSSDLKPLGNKKDGGGGIKGVRPPLLSPPPVLLPPIVDNMTSTWDLLRSLSGDVVDSPIRDGGISSSGEEDERGVDENFHGVRHEGSNLLSDSCSSTSHDDDESNVGGYKVPGVVDESVYNVSPNGSFRRIFNSWQKGEILGKGSFGTVYEGFTE